MNGRRLSDWRWWLGIPDRLVTSAPVKRYGITVMVPAYNEEKSIAETIRSIQAQTASIDEIIVIDDHSSDRTGEIAGAMGVTVVRTDRNQGTKSSAQQYVLDRGLVRTELFVTIDADTLLAPDAIELTLPYFNDESTASVCGYVIPARVHTVWERGRLIEYLFSISLFKAAQNHVGGIMVSSGCFSVCRTDPVIRNGGFDGRTMGEDMDLTWELSMKGHRVYCERKALCYPYDPPTGRIFVAQLDRWYRAYFQNLAVHWKGLLARNRRLGAFAIGYLVDGTLVLFLSLWTMLVALRASAVSALVIAMVFDVGIVSFFSIVEGVRLGRLRQVLASLPAYYVVRPVNVYVFWRSLWREWILRDALRSWQKGH